MGEIVVIGGGAAGMMAALTARRQGADVTLLERNGKLGKKLRITGKGRCNVTNDCTAQTVLQNTPGNGRFLHSALSQFSPADAKAFFQEDLGVPLKTERGNRVFPQSDNAHDIADALSAALRREGVALRTGRAEAILLREDRVCGVKLESGGKLDAGAVILATGGVSYPATGSTGDGYRMAKSLGHTIVTPRGSLVPLEAEGCAQLQGLSLRNIAVTVTDQKGKRLYQDFGELLFTHFGLSGPVILSASAHMRDFAHSRYRVLIDLKPALDEATLDARLLRDFQAFANRDFQNSLGDLLPRKLIDEVIRRSGIPPETKVHDITRAQRHALLQVLKCFSVEVTAPRPVRDAIVTSGGVDVREVSPSTMESRRIPGLYFAGEVLDVDAYTGGFNLQIAWSTGYTAGCWAAWNL